MEKFFKRVKDDLKKQAESLSAKRNLGKLTAKQLR